GEFRCRYPLEHLTQDVGFLPPVSREVQARPIEVEGGGLGPDQRAGGEVCRPVHVRPGLLRDVPFGCGARARQPRELEADRTCAGRPDGERRGEHRCLPFFTGERGDLGGDVHVRGAEDPVGVEQREEPAGAVGPVGVVDVGVLEIHRPCPSRGAAPSRRSESSVTSPGGGAQKYTPAAWPSMTGVSGPAIPRTYRYSTPPMCSPGSY